MVTLDLRFRRELQELIVAAMERLRKKRTDAIATLAPMLDVKPRQIYRWLNGEDLPPNISEALDMLDHLNDNADKLFPAPKQEFAVTAQEKIFSSPDRDIVTIPVLGTIPAGPPAEVSADEIVEYLPMSKRGLNAGPKNYYILRVAGDSMAPTINDGDEVLIRYTTDVVEGKIIAAKVDGKFTLKKCCGNKGELLPINGKHDKVVAREDIQILGVAERVIKKL